MAKTFEDLDVFNRAVSLMVAVYRATEDFPRREQYGLASQLRRASVSVLSDIAEGQGRLTPGEWRQMLSHARGSLFEVEAQLIAATKLGYLDEISMKQIRSKCKSVGKPLAGLIAYVQTKEADKRQPAPGNR